MKTYELNVNPRILDLLGPNLYTNIYYVLAELIANAYDADAKNVYIIAGPDDIRVEDDGHGMSYRNQEIKKYLNVAGVSRTSEKNSMTRSGHRKKMGRKGVGKLAALSVSENVDITTISKGEKSGFVLSRNPEEGSKLAPIPEKNIKFEYVKNHGTSVLMKKPRYRLHKTLSAVQKNILKIFPLIGSDFKVHIIRGKEKVQIKDFDRGIMKELCGLITLGKPFEHLCDLVPKEFENRHKDLVVSEDPHITPIVMTNNDETEREYNLEVEGWIGVYKSTRGKKKSIQDFPDNFISLFANKKLGEFNILPAVGQNKLNEVYVVGQLHVDIFEKTELPDMALSNRQGYKSDDPRYEEVLRYVRSNLLQDILKIRELYTNIKNKKKETKKYDDKKKKEEELKESYIQFRKQIINNAASKISQLGRNPSEEKVQEAITSVFDDNVLQIGLKAVVDTQKKKLLISQTSKDKSFSDIVYSMLAHNNVPPEDILYTNCDDEICRVPEGIGVYEFLRTFFVDSCTTEKIYVLFVTSENTKQSWGAITEVGASWITKVDHKIFNIHPFKPEHPLDDEAQWQTTNREKPTSGKLWMNPLNADIFCQKIEDVCKRLGYPHKKRIENKRYLDTLVDIIKD